VIILKFIKLTSGWNAEEYELAFQLSEQEMILEDLIEYVEEVKGK
jgi:hypothetical protein